MTDQPIRIFIAYAHEDDTSRDKLRRQLNVLERRGHFQIFWDGLIQPGGRWDTRLKDELHRADIFLLLVSEAFLDSTTCMRWNCPKPCNSARWHPVFPTTKPKRNVCS